MNKKVSGQFIHNTIPQSNTDKIIKISAIKDFMYAAINNKKCDNKEDLCEFYRSYIKNIN